MVLYPTSGPPALPPHQDSIVPILLLPQDIPSPPPRTSENKEMLLAKPKLDGAGLGAKARTKRGLSLGLALLLLNVGATWRDISPRGPLATWERLGRCREEQSWRLPHLPFLSWFPPSTHSASE